MRNVYGLSFRYLVRANVPAKVFLKRSEKVSLISIPFLSRVQSEISEQQYGQLQALLDIDLPQVKQWIIIAVLRFRIR
jgi:hypothetical protein